MFSTSEIKVLRKQSLNLDLKNRFLTVDYRRKKGKSCELHKKNVYCISFLGCVGTPQYLSHILVKRASELR